MMTTLLFIGLGATVLSLFMGLMMFLSNNTKYRLAQGNKMMKWRVLIQGVTLIIFALLLMGK